MSFHPNSRAAGKSLAAGVVLPFALLLTTALLTPAKAQESSQWSSGKALYDKVCGYCHDPAAGVGTILAGRVLPEAYIRMIVRNGFNAMPAFPASFIDDKALAQVAGYLATLPAPDQSAQPAQP